MVIIFGIILLVIIANWKIYEKANQPGWACIVPIYSTLVLLRIVGKPWWWLLLLIIPYIGLIWYIWTVNLLSKKFGKDEGFTIGLIFLPFIFYPILGFGNSKYQAETLVSSKKSEGFDASDCGEKI